MMAVLRRREGAKRAIILASMTALTLTQIMKVGDQDVTVLFIQRPPLSWPAHYYGYLMALDYGVMGLTLLGLLPLLTGGLLSLSDAQIVLVAICFKLVKCVWAGLCTHGWMMYSSVVCGALGGLVSPGLRSVITKTAEDGEVGKLLAMQSSLETMSKLLGSGLFTAIYSSTTHLWPCPAYLCQVVGWVVMGGLMLWMTPRLTHAGCPRHCSETQISPCSTER